MHGSLGFAKLAGLPALWGGEPGQVRKEAAIIIYCKCRGQGSPPFSNGSTLYAGAARYF